MVASLTAGPALRRSYALEVLGDELPALLFWRAGRRDEGGKGGSEGGLRERRRRGERKSGRREGRKKDGGKGGVGE